MLITWRVKTFAFVLKMCAYELGFVTSFVANSFTVLDLKYNVWTRRAQTLRIDF